MKHPRQLRGNERQNLIDELHRKYASKPGTRQRLVYLRKRYGWMIVIASAKTIKRAIDITSAVFLLTLFSPLIVIIAALIKFTDWGPVLYTTERVGQYGQEFRFPKFRSMQIGADQMKAELLEKHDAALKLRFKLKEDPRITWIGKIIRRTSLDELPQLWCILKGDMSLVGPRPPLPEEVAHYNLEQRKRLDTVPGLTGLWQVSGRSDVPFSRQVKLDLQYIESQSFWLDIKILLKTIPAVIFGRGAY